MTNSTHVERLRTVAMPAAAALAKGPTGAALFAAKQGYGAARQGYGAAKKGRKARQARVVAPNITRAPALPASHNMRRIALLGTLAVIAVSAAAYLARGRKEQPPVAAAPPSLADYGPAGAGVPVI